jgi:Flp pilus assembly protein TadG
MVTLVLLAMILLLAYAAPVTRTQAEIENGARDAARAASIGISEGPPGRNPRGLPA